MEVEVKKIDDCRRKLKISVPVERVAKELDLAYKRVALSAKVPGFRPGRAPKKVLELHYGGRIAEDVKSKLVSETFSEALKLKEVEPAAYPRIDVGVMTLNIAEPFSYEVDVDVWPSVRISGYKGIRAVMEKAVVQDKEVDDSINMLRDRQAEFNPVEGRTLQLGDFAILDLSAKVDGKSFDHKKGLWIEMANGSYLPGFCGKIVGMEPGQDRTFNLALPADLNDKELSGKEATFEVVLKEIKQKKLPPLDEDFCKSIGNYKNIEELRKAIRENLQRSAETREKNSVVEQINDYLLKHNKVPLPESRVELETVELAERIARRLVSTGWKKEDVIKDKDRLMASARKEAEKNLRLYYIYTEVAKREKISVSDGELEEEIKKMAQSLKKDPREVRGSLEKDGKLKDFREAMKKDKVVEFLIKSGKIKEGK